MLGTWAFPLAAQAESDGTLDITFDTDGKLTTPVLAGQDRVNSLAIQPDGKIVAGGWAFNGKNDDFALARYNTNGSLDTSFDSDGKVTTSIRVEHDRVYSIAIQPDGKIVAGGVSNDGGTHPDFGDFAMARYNTNGSLDTTFDTDGMLTIQIGVFANWANSIAIQPDGKIVAGGMSWNGTSYDFTLLRWDANGSPDLTFDTDGLVTSSIGSFDDRVSSIALQPDGKIVAGGVSHTAAGFTNPDFALARWNSNGSLDTTFDTDGMVTTPIGSAFDDARSIVLQADGKIVVGGVSHNGTNNDFALARYNTNGSLDPAFDTDGKLTTAIGSGADDARWVALQSNGKIVAGGLSHNGTDNDFALARYTTGGALDTGFDGDGKLTTPIAPSRDDGAASLAIQADGKIVAGGWSGDTPPDDDFALARYDSLPVPPPPLPPPPDLPPPPGQPPVPPGSTVSPSATPPPAPSDSRSADTCRGETMTIQIKSPNRITIGTAGDDVINGTTGSDTIHGFGRNDLVCGRGGDDALYGGGGGGGGIWTDRVFGGAGQDRIYGDGGDDVLVGGQGDDSLSGNPGDDQFNGGPGTDACTGGPGLDTGRLCEPFDQ
jgi:uncharacterized delta-60 repeat protein